MFKFLTVSMLALTTFADMSGMMTITETFAEHQSLDVAHIGDMSDDTFTVTLCDTDEEFTFDLGECISDIKIDSCKNDEVTILFYSESDCSGFHMEGAFTENECVSLLGDDVKIHCNGKFPNKVKWFFEDYWKYIVISAVVSCLIISVIYMCAICRKKRRVIAPEDNAV